ncbi:16S rRNA (guanine(966)-N(2))-methyltransferase RsmD [Luteimonas sp. MC1572]|uniref:16S rRNA (guanine(966)-N(2))-methyltransferase RsmD n=1 Tax=Luteimonas sp. MC1572 TaxID=2799325 RepID=UPI0018F08696|nr:16S rRNA (guanine(966)-N(2))-methyltransferase RsmD [Luteimonas sp. MC1572]MBJ6980384.1 16S rRNA (guanine(966)-N(2))-methyltransferase RsmD [Luteimonas sp. MC1572]QQO04267.1 16S rRNA (guanine(966)-N(2))-methyltransferase RsmD [Luteimonas sp. MC1572]
MVPPAHIPTLSPRARPAGSVRIIGGQWRGSKLPVADAPGLRPTSDRARETLFNWLQPMLHGARVLDLFAGSGALGFEALSRGAAEALLVERDPALVQALYESCERLHAGDAAKVVRADALEWLRLPVHGRFDLVFVDPPFADGAWAAALQRLPPWLARDAWLYLESPAGVAPDPGAGWRLHRESATRDARHALYRHATADAAGNGPA